MKVWMGYGSEHSAKLVIIGQFRAAEDAADALRLLEKMRNAAYADQKDGNIEAGEIGKEVTDRFLKIYTEENFPVGPADAEQLLYEFHPKQVGDKVVITTDESEINTLIRVLLHGSAKVEVFSAHDYETEHY